jgi:predicted phage-related endonuclease
MELQQPIAQVFSRRMHLPIQWWDQRIYHPERAWQYASPDALILTQPQEILEVKTCSLRYAGDWDRPEGEFGDEDQIPDYYWVQVEWQMSVMQLETAWIAVLIAGNDFRVYKIHHDPVLEEILLEQGEKCWRENLMSDVMPQISASQAARNYIRQKHPREKQPVRLATREEIQLLDEYGRARQEFAKTKNRKEGLENQLCQAIGDAEGLSWSGGRMTWKRSRDHFETNWEELAKHQLVGYADDERQALIQQFTHPEPGTRRIYFKEEYA